MITLPPIRCPGCGRMMPQVKAREVPQANTYRDCLRHCTHCRIGATNAKNSSKVKFIHAGTRPGETSAAAAPTEQPKERPHNQLQETQAARAETIIPEQPIKAVLPEQPIKAAAAPEPADQPGPESQPSPAPAAPPAEPRQPPPVAGIPQRPRYNEPRGGRQYDRPNPRRFGEQRGDDSRGGRPGVHFGAPKQDSHPRPDHPAKHYGPPRRDSRYGDSRPRKHYGPPPRDAGSREEGPNRHFGPPQYRDERRPGDDRPWQSRSGKPYGRPGPRKFGHDRRGPGDHRSPQRPRKD